MFHSELRSTEVGMKGSAMGAYGRAVDDEATPFGLRKKSWANVKGLGELLGLLSIFVAAGMYLWDAEDRKRTQINDAWRRINDRPTIRFEHSKWTGQPQYSARTWGAREAIVYLVKQEQELGSIELNYSDLSDAQLNKAKLRSSALVHTNTSLRSG